MSQVLIKTNEINLPDIFPHTPARLLAVMADDIRKTGWPATTVLAVRRVEGGFEAQSDFALLKAAQMANLEEIPCQLQNY